MEEILKALAPFPLLEGIVLGLMVAAAGVWAMRRGMQESYRRKKADEDVLSVQLKIGDEERRAQWKAYDQLSEIHQNSSAMVNLLGKLVEGQLLSLAAINRLSDMRWNKLQ